MCVEKWSESTYALRSTPGLRVFLADCSGERRCINYGSAGKLGLFMKHQDCCRDIWTDNHCVTERIAALQQRDPVGLVRNKPAQIAFKRKKKALV